MRGFADLCRRLSIPCELSKPLARHTSLGIGGPSPVHTFPDRAESVMELISWMAGHGLGWKLLGAGSNVLIPDRGVDHAVLNLSGLTEGVCFAPDFATFPAGTPTAQAMRLCAERGLGGLSWAAGLPGTLGGAAAGNAGCWGGEMSQAVHSLDVVTADSRLLHLSAAGLSWEYRTLDLALLAGEGATIVSVVVKVRAANSRRLQQEYERLQALKRQRQPIGSRNAGCIFRNPASGPTAGQLADLAGCKGLRVGNAQVSELHGNFILNLGTATGEDVEALIALVRERVERHGQQHLETEIRRW